MPSPFPHYNQTKPMTSLVLTPEILASIRKDLQAPKPTLPSKPRKQKYLPGESRKTCGPAGFQPLSAQTIRNLTSAQHYREPNIISSGRAHEVHKATGACESTQASVIPTSRNLTHNRHMRQLQAQSYTRTLLEHLTHITYSRWNPPGVPWSYNQSTLQCSPQTIPC